MFDLGHYRCGGLARYCAPLDGEVTAVGVGGEADTAGDRRRVKRWTSKQRVLARRQQFRVEHIERGEKQSCMSNGIDADIPSTPVCRATSHGDINPGEAFVCRHDRETGWLSDDRRIGANAFGDQGPCSEARVLLVDDRRDNDFSIDRPATCAHRARGSRGHRGDTRFHVRGAATIQSPFAHRRIPWRVRHALHADDVDVAIEDQ